MNNKHCTRCGFPSPEEALFCSQCGNALHRADQDPLIGQTIASRYYLIERIGQGGAGTLYRAEHVTLRRRMAVKLLHQQLSINEEAVERFRREAITVCEIDNDHILQVHDFGRSEDGRLFFAMEYLEGEPLSAVLEREGPLLVDRGIDIMAQISDALMEAHALGYVHRDLRPRNIFLTKRRGKSDFVKLLDFGLAKLVQLDVDAAKTTMGMTFGNPQYMAPEQARGELVDRRADIYSLGALAFEMLTGQTPYKGAGTFDILSKVLDAPVPRIRDLRPDCPEWLESVVRVALAKAPADRFATVAQLLEALERKQVLERQPPFTIQVAAPKESQALLEKMTPMTAPAPSAPATAGAPAGAGSPAPAGRTTRAYEAVKLDAPATQKAPAEEGRPGRMSRKERRQQEQDRRAQEKQTRTELRVPPLGDLGDRKAREAAARQLADQAAREAAQVEVWQREQAARKNAEEEAVRKNAEEEAARKKAEEEAAARKAEEEAARKKAEEEAARRKAEEEAARRKAEEEAARRKAEEEAEQELERKTREASSRAKVAARILQHSSPGPAPQRNGPEAAPAHELTREPSARAAMDREAIAREAAAWEEAAQQLLASAEEGALASQTAKPVSSAAPTPVGPSQDHPPGRSDLESRFDVSDTTVPVARMDAQDADLPPLAVDQTSPPPVPNEAPTPQMTGEHEADWFSKAAGATPSSQGVPAYPADEEYEPPRRRLPAVAGYIAAGVALVAIGAVLAASRLHRPSGGEATTGQAEEQPRPQTPSAATPQPAPVPPPAPRPAPAPAPAGAKEPPPQATAAPPAPAAPTPQVSPPPAAPPAPAQPGPSQVSARTPTPQATPLPPPAPAPVPEPPKAKPPEKASKEPPQPQPKEPRPQTAAKEPPRAPAKEPARAPTKEPPRAQPPAKRAEEAPAEKKAGAEEVESLVQAGRQKLQAGDVSAAAASFNKARELDPRSADATAGLGEVAFEQGNWDDAVRQLQKAIKLAPRRASYQVLLGQSLYKLGRYKDAAEVCRKALKQDPSLREAQQTLDLAEKKLSDSSGTP